MIRATLSDPDHLAHGFGLMVASRSALVNYLPPDLPKLTVGAMVPGTTMFYISPQRWAEMAILRAKERAADSDRACVRSWQRIAASQELLRQDIRGGSAADTLNEKIRAALIAGTLPRVDFRLWAGKASGNRVCACCELPIARGQVEYEPQSAPGLYAHLPCFTVWRAESERRKKPRGSAPGATAAGA